MVGSYIEQYSAGPDPNDISRTDTTLGFTWGSLPLYLGLARLTTPQSRSNRMAERFSASYTTGSHAFKVGISDEQSWQGFTITANGNVNYTFNQGKYVNGVVNCPTCGATIVDVPSSITEYATPYPLYDADRGESGHLCPGPVDDQPADAQLRPALQLLRRLRPARVGGPDRHSCPSRATSTRSTACRAGRTSIRGSGRRTTCSGTGRRRSRRRGPVREQPAHHDCPANNPFNTSVNSVTRSWNDPTGNGASVPNCDLTNPPRTATAGRFRTISSACRIRTRRATTRRSSTATARATTSGTAR